MNYEQRYELALARAKDMMSYREVRREDLEYIFPELKESEGEKIRKQIISFLKEFEHDHYRSLDFSSWIAWLERQGEQKPVDKVEPKFKNGQWIVWKDKCYKVNYNGCGYELVDQNGLSTSLEYGTNDENAHLWTINDVKDGDVLVASDGSIFIYKNQIVNGVVHYVAVTPYNDLVINKNDYCWESKNACYPATKDEQTILFERIKEAGYEWDANKKELIKL